MRRALFAVAAAAAALGVPQPASAATEVFAAYGEGTTVCRIEISKRHDYGFLSGGEGFTNFYGRTDCTAPVDQTAHAVVPLDGSEPALDGGTCTGIKATCFSGQDAWGVANDQPMTFTLSLRAPRGQGWVGSPAHCTGVGTDNLRCEFSINGVLWYAI